MKILVIVLNKFKNDSRILKELETLDKLDFVSEISLYAVWDEGLAEKEKLGEKITVNRVKSNIKCKHYFCKVLKFFDIFRKIVKINKNKYYDLLHVHDISALPIGAVLKRKLNAKLIYDSHEIQSEICSSSNIYKKIVFFVEKLFISKPDKVIVVSESIKEWYEKKFLLNNISVLRNIPIVSNKYEEVQLRKRIGLKDDDILFIYLGNLVPKKRAIEELLEIFSKDIPNKHILFMGNGLLRESILKYSKKSEHIHYLDAVAPNEVLNYAKEADIGINFGRKDCLNSYYGIANKLFEYIASGTAVIVSDFPERSRIIDQFNCGWKLQTDKVYDIKQIEDLILSITQEEVKTKKENALNNAHSVSWENESKVLMELYKELNDAK